MGRAWLYSLTILIGLWISATAFGGLLPDNLAEWPVNIWCLGLFGWLFNNAERKERIEMLTVLAFATPMELFFSEVWLIYEYQRGLMPLFVPKSCNLLIFVATSLLRSPSTMKLPISVLINSN